MSLFACPDIRGTIHRRIGERSQDQTASTAYRSSTMNQNSAIFPISMRYVNAWNCPPRLRPSRSANTRTSATACASPPSTSIGSIRTVPLESFPRPRPEADDLRLADVITGEEVPAGDVPDDVVGENL